MRRTRAESKLPDLTHDAGASSDALDATAQGGGATLSSRAYQQIREMLIDGRLEEGAVVSEQSLAEQLGISRTPVREAVRRLRKERIVEQVHRVGTMVRRPTAREWVELYDLREALEVWVARRAAEEGVAREVGHRLGELCDALMILARRLAADPAGEADAGARERFFAADLAFHLTLMESVGNAAMIQLIREMRLFTGTFARRRHPVVDAGIVAGVWVYHRRIANAVRRGDPVAAAATMAAHIRASRDGMLGFLFEDEGAADAPSE